MTNFEGKKSKCSLILISQIKLLSLDRSERNITANHNRLMGVASFRMAPPHPQGPRAQWLLMRMKMMKCFCFSRLAVTMCSTEPVSNSYPHAVMYNLYNSRWQHTLTVITAVPHLRDPEGQSRALQSTSYFIS